MFVDSALIQIILQNSWSKSMQINFWFKSEHWVHRVLFSQIVLEHYKFSTFLFLSSSFLVFSSQVIQSNTTSIFYILSKTKIIFLLLLCFIMLYILKCFFEVLLEVFHHFLIFIFGNNSNFRKSRIFQ